MPIKFIVTLINNKKMKQIFLFFFVGIVINFSAVAKDWKSSYQMGVMEYFIDDGKGNKILLSCPDEKLGNIIATINSKYPNPKLGEKLTFFIDGQSMGDNHKNEDCRACASAFIDFYEKLRNAKSISVIFSSTVSKSFSVASIKKTLPIFNKSDCKTGF